MRMILRFVLGVVLVGSLQSMASAGWTKCAGPDGRGSGWIWSFLEYKGSLFVGTAGGGLFRSSDDGANWTSVFCCDSFAFPMSLAAVGDTILVGTAWGGVFRSVDDGATWNQSGLMGNYVGTLVTNGNHLFAGTRQGVYRSTDAGSSWTLTTTSYAFFSETGIAVRAGKIYLMSGHLSTDDGNTWEDMQFRRTSDAHAIVAIDSGIFIAADSVYRSTDDGQHWTTANTGVNPGFHIISLAARNDTLYAGSDAVYRSTDGGTRWFPLGPDATQQGVFRMLVRDDDLFAGTGGAGLLHSRDGGATWTDANSGLACADLDVLFTHDSMVIAEPARQGVRLSVDRGDHWSRDSVPFPGNTLTAITRKGDTLVASVDSGGVYVSTDHGNSWLLRDNGLSGSMAWLGATTTCIFAGNDSGIFRTRDLGLHWTRAETNAWDTTIYILDDGHPDTSVFLPDVTSFAAVGATAVLGSGRGVFVSTDDGDHWIRPDTNGPSLQVNAMATIGNTAFAGTDRGVLRAVGGLSPWRPADSTLTGYITSLAVAGHTLFAGLWGWGTPGGGVFVSDDGGDHWRTANTGLGNLDIRAMAADERFLYVHPNGGSLWRRPLVELQSAVSEEWHPRSPDVLVLQNRPNPFPSSTEISFDLPSAQRITLDVYSALGECMATVACGHFSAGEHRVMIDASTWRSGVYWYRLATNAGITSRAMVVVK